MKISCKEWTQLLVDMMEALVDLLGCPNQPGEVSEVSGVCITNPDFHILGTWDGIV